MDTEKTSDDTYWTLKDMQDTLQRLFYQSSISFAEWLRKNYIPLPSGWRIGDYQKWVNEKRRIWTTEELLTEYKRLAKEEEEK
jgi:stage III sporulation protein SpoIIIAA